MEASCCVDRKIFLSPASASSRARTLASRPTINGVICCGKMTISRTGIIGMRFISCFSRVNIQAPELLKAARFRKRALQNRRPPQPFAALRVRGGRYNPLLAGFLKQTPIDFATANHIRGDHEIAHALLHRQVVHQFQHEVFEDHTQAARADLALKSQLRDCFQSVIGETEADVFEFEQALVLLEERVFRLGQNLYQGALVEVAHDAGDGKAADKLGNQAVTDQIAGLHLFEQFRVAALRRGGCANVRMEAQGAAADALLENLFQNHERATADKENVRGVHRGKFLVGMLAAALGRHIGDGPFENLEQSLLDALTADVAGDGGVFVLLGDLVDFVDIDDALLGFLDVAVGGLQQLQNNVFDVFANVASFGERGGVDDSKGHIEHAGKGLGQQGFSGARRADQKDIGLAELDFARLLVEEDAFVVVVDSDGELLLGAILADDIAVEKLLDFRRARQAARRGGGLFALFVFENRLADADTLVADVRPGVVGRRTDELLHLFLRLVAEGTAERFVWAIFFHVCEGLSPAQAPVNLHSRPNSIRRERESMVFAVKRQLGGNSM